MHPLLLRYFKKYPLKQAPFMHQQLQAWQETRPLAGLRVLHHLPLVPNTLLKIACLIAAGADLIVTNPHSFIKPHSEAVDCLNHCNIPYVENLQTLAGEKFDLYYDCGAELYQALGAPTVGAVELTASGDNYYRTQSLSFPVMSIDPTLTKQLETVFGSAESASLAIQRMTHINPKEKNWLIFGFGKIGLGLAYFCVQHHAAAIVADINPHARAAAQALGIPTLDPQDTPALEHALSTTDIVITATGKAASLNHYPQTWFKNKILANMGIYDEFGPHFQTEAVLNNKLPINFILEDPTPIHYIDPEFYAHNIAALPLLERPFSAGVHDLARELDDHIIRDWCEFHRVPHELIQKWFWMPPVESSPSIRIKK
ncbi:MAG: adenosylhomocysteinase [Gammaproteobacteria bacterium]|nr:adenosylhomocysteinase [Gammaproteobacteria bacterium]